MREVAVQAKQLQQERRLPSAGSTRENSSDEEADQASVKRLDNSRKKIKKSRKVDNATSHWKMQSQRGMKRKFPDTTLLPCLTPVCCRKEKKHFIQNCPNASDEDNVKFRDQYRANKKARMSPRSNEVGGTINKFDKKTLDTKLAKDELFEASLLEGKVLACLMADQGVDTNLMPHNGPEQIWQMLPERQWWQ